MGQLFGFVEVSNETLPQRIIEIVGYVMCIIFIPVTIHANIKLYRNRDEMFFKKRETPFLLNATFIFAMITLPVCQLVFLHLYSILIQSIMALLYFLSWYLLLYFLIVKTWIIYYKCHQSIYMEEREWQQIINKTDIPRSSRKQSWFIRNSNRYANVSYVRKRVAAVFFCGFLLGSAASVTVTQPTREAVRMIAISMILLALFAPIIIYAVIVYKTPSYHDIYNIHWECRIHSKLIILLLVTLFVNIAVITFTHDIANMVYLWTLQVTVLYTMNHISTYCMLSKHSNNDANDNTDYVMVGNTKHVSLEMVLKTKNALHLFAVHLSKEFSLECLLSVIEFNDLIKYCIDSMEDEEKEELLSHDIDEQKVLIEFPDNVPTSGIIQHLEHPIIRSNKMFVAKVKAQKLYKRYILNGCHLEINLSYKQRMQCKDVLHNLEHLLAVDITLTDLVKLFHETKLYMIQLLNFSLIRYKQDPTFDVVVALFEK